MCKDIWARSLLLFYFLAHAVWATSNDTQIITFDIKETQVEVSLLKFASQANLSFFVSYDLLAGLKTSPLVGDFSIADAAKILFLNTNLVARFDENGNFNLVNKERKPIQRVPPPPIEAKIEIDSTEIITITGRESGFKRKALIKLLSLAANQVINEQQLHSQASQNLSENLQRNAGIAISRQFGEGADVSIRGFGPQYNITTINGRTIATSQANRDFDFRLLPSEFVSMLYINKAPNAQTTAGSIGANIDVKTAKPFDNRGFNSFATLALNQNDLSKSKSDYHYSGLVSNTFKHDSIGLMLGLLDEDTHNRFDHYSTQRLALSNTLPDNLELPVLDAFGNQLDIEHIRRPLRFIYDVQNSEQKRTSFNGVMQYSNLDYAVHTLDFIYAQYKRRSFSSGVQLPGQSPNFRNVILDQNNSLIKATIFDNNIDAVFEEQIENIDTFALGYNGKFDFHTWSFVVDFSHSNANSFSSLNSLVPHYTLDDGAERFVNLDFSRSDILASTTNIPTTDSSKIKAHWNGKLDSKLADKVNEFKIDFEKNIDTGVLNQVNFGAQYFDREKQNQQLKWNDNYQCSPCGGIVDLPNELFDVVEYPNFLNQATGDIPRAWLTINNLKAYNQTIQYILAEGNILADGDIWNETVFDPSASYVNAEQNSALYFELKFDGNVDSLWWNLDLGSRYIFVNNTASGFLQKIERIELDPNSSSNELRLRLQYSPPKPSQTKTYYDYFLPSANLNLIFDQTWALKFAAAKVISFPLIEEIGINQRFTSDDSGSVLLTGGNPELKPYSAYQYDIAAEFIASEHSFFSMSLFFKDMKNFIATDTLERTFTGQVSEEVLARRAEIIEIVNRSQNVAGGSIAGIEASMILKLSTLCTWCNGLTIDSNFTRIVSNSMNVDPILLAYVKEPEATIEGLSEFSYHLNIAYQSQRYAAFISWNWRSAFLHARQGSRTSGLPEHTEGMGQLDARFSYSFDSGEEVFFEAFNLTNSRHLEYADIRSRVTHIEYSGTTYKLGISKRW